MTISNWVKNTIFVTVPCATLLAIVVSVYQRSEKKADVEVQKLQAELAEQDVEHKKRQEVINLAYARCKDDGGVMISGFYKFACIQSSCVKWEQAYGQHDIW